ncbi:hypothetical protein ACLKA7_005031, partial [Drosophila subpalustris]
DRLGQNQQHLAFISRLRIHWSSSLELSLILEQKQHGGLELVANSTLQCRLYHWTRHHNNAGSNLSADWLRKVEWAKSVIPDWQQSSRALALTKRQRSQEAPAPSAKKSRVQTGKSFAQIARERILIGVLDQGNQDGRIPRNQWRWVESALATQCLQLLEREPGPPPICRDMVWYQGSVKRQSVGRAVDWEEVPVKPRTRMWFPSTIKEPEQLLKMLQRSNPSLPTHDWRVAKIEETPGPTHQAVIILNKESLTPIDAAGEEQN